MTKRPNLEVSTWKAQATGWGGAVFFAFCAIMSWRAGQSHVSPWFIPFVLLSIPILLLTGTVQS